jgi:hypothetical protein
MQEHKRQMLGLLLAHLNQYEMRYGVGSNRLAEVFTDDLGEVHESNEFRDWSLMYEEWRKLVRSAAAGPDPIEVEIEQLLAQRSTADT